MIFARDGLEKEGDLSIWGNFYAKGKVSCKTLNVEGDAFIEGELFCQEINVTGSLFVRGRVHLSCEGTSVPSSCKVTVGRDFISEGCIVAHGGEMTIGGRFSSTSMAKLGYTRVKVMENIDVQYLYCGQLTSAGNVDVRGMLDAKGRIYVLGDINSLDLTSNYNNIYCGGMCYANLYSSGKVFENVQTWKNLS